MSLTCRVLTAGTCTHLERAVHRRGRLRYVDLPSLFGLIEHPTEGLVLYDTGWSPWLERLPPWLPRAAYRAFVPFRVDDRSSAAGQLRALGHDPAAVRHVIASHFHADHVGGLPDFPNATVHASAAAWYHLKRSCRFTLWRQGYFPSLISEDQRVSLVGDLRGGGWGPFARTHDLFGDGTLRLLELGGHAPGQLGLLLSLEGGQVLFAADAAWVTGNIRDQVGPSRVAQHAIFHNHSTYAATLGRLHEAWRTQPRLRIVPSHCPDVAKGLVAFP